MSAIKFEVDSLETQLKSIKVHRDPLFHLYPQIKSDCRQTMWEQFGVLAHSLDSQILYRQEFPHELILAYSRFKHVKPEFQSEYASINSMNHLFHSYKFAF